MTGVGQHRLGVIVIHVLANPVTHSGSERVGGHGDAVQGELILTPALSPCETLPKQEAQANP
jgi:hypothetical protein